jgi:hypothetical protein
MKHEHIKLRRPQYYNNLPTHLSPGGNPQNQNQLPGRRLARPLPGRRLARPGGDRQCLGTRPVRHLAEAGTLVQIFTAILTWLSRPVRLRPLTCIYTVEPRGLEPLR